MDSQLSLYKEKVSSLQAEIISLRQQLVSADRGLTERDRARQEMLEHLDSVQAVRVAEHEKV